MVHVEFEPDSYWEGMEEVVDTMGTSFKVTCSMSKDHDGVTGCCGPCSGLGPWSPDGGHLVGP